MKRIVYIIVTIVIVAGIGAAVWSHRSMVDSSPANSSVSTQDWKIYSGPSGYSVQYPNNWKTDTMITGSDTQFEHTTISDPTNKEDLINLSGSITRGLGFQGQSFEDWATDYMHGYEEPNSHWSHSPLTKTTVNGYPAITTDIHPTYDTNSPGTRIVFIAAGKDLYDIDYPLDLTPQGVATVKKIIDSFKSVPAS